MIYGFEFQNQSLIYIENGSRTEEEAISKLEKFAAIHCKHGKQARGEVYLVNESRSRTLRNYKIELRDGILNLQTIK